MGHALKCTSLAGSVGHHDPATSRCLRVGGGSGEGQLYAVLATQPGERPCQITTSRVSLTKVDVHLKRMVSSSKEYAERVARGCLLIKGDTAMVSRLEGPAQREFLMGFVSESSERHVCIICIRL